MLLWLTEYLTRFETGFNVFSYLTMRAILGALTALVICFVVGPYMIARLSLRQIGQTVRDDGPATHLLKAGTPTMGGALILIAIAVSTLLWADLSNRFVWVVLLVTLAFGGIGFVDDYKKLILKDPTGLAPRFKLLWQSVFAVGAAVFLYVTAVDPVETSLLIPFLKDVAIPLGAAQMLVTYFYIVGFSNAVNLTDGLDGLAIMPSVLVGGALGVFASVTGNVNFSEYLGIPYVAGTGEILVFCAALAGAGLGFLWFNCFPAQVFMGDTGSLALGAALGYVAFLCRQEIALAIAGLIFVVDGVSVVLQIGSYRLTGKRLLPFAPISNWWLLRVQHEVKVTIRYWIVAALMGALSLALLKVR